MSRDQTASIDGIRIIVKRTRLVMPELSHRTVIVVYPIIVNKRRGFFMLV